MKISAIQLAQVKRIAQNISSLEKKRQAIQTKIKGLLVELSMIEEGIETWETPVRAMTGGRTSSEILIKEDNKYVINPEIVKQEGSSYEILETLASSTELEKQEVEEKIETIHVLKSVDESTATAYQEEKAEREGTVEETTVVPDAEENNWTNF